MVKESAAHKKQSMKSEIKQKCLAWWYCHQKVLTIGALMGMLVFKVIHPTIDPWT